MSDATQPSRVVLVTGASKGIGLSFAGAALAAGHSVALTGARDTERLHAAARDLARTHGADRVLAVQSDAGLPQEAESCVARVLDRFGRLDVLVNNAGRGPREIAPSFHVKPPAFWEIAPEGWAEIVRTNVNGPFLMARAAAPGMVAQGWGRIIGISTSRVTMVRQGFAPYGPSKAALDAMTRVFAQDLAGTGVTANILLPGGATDTEFIPEGNRSGTYLNLLPVDVMNAALLWLISSASDGVTGARLVGARWSPDDPSACREDTGAPPLIL